MWLNFLTMLRRGCCVAPIWLLLASAAPAATLNFNGGAAGGCTLSGNIYSCASLSLSDTDIVSIASNYKVVVNSALSFGYNQGLRMTGSAQLETSGNLNIGDINPANLAVSGGTLTTQGNFKIGSQAQTIVADVNAATMTIGTGSATKITGTITATSRIDMASHVTINGPITSPVLATNSGVTLNGNINATTSFQLASGSSVTGNITSAKVTLDSSSSVIKGDIDTTGALDVGSQVTVTGSVKAASLLLRASGSVINGTTKVTGNVDLQSGTTINGDLSARDVLTYSSNAIINGNASVNSIFIDWSNSVNGVITCAGALNGTEPCSCVSKPKDYSYKPTCGVAPATGVHHFQIDHSGVALTCQPQTVKLKACADASCSSTYTGETTVTLEPNGGQVTLKGNGEGAVSWPVAGAVTLKASSSGVTAANVCNNANDSQNPCQMIFKDQGMVLTAPDHISMASGVKLNVQALQNSQGSCVPLVAGKTIDVNFSCGYVNPASGAHDVGVGIGGTNVSCGSGTTKVSLSFNASGLATPALQYAEVGQASINAAYAIGNLSALGATQFTAAPASFKLEPQRADGSGISPTTFIKASEPFTIKLTALNAAGNVTENFGRESPAQGFAIPTPELIIPDQTYPNRNNAITMGGYKGIVKGVAAAADGAPGLWQFDDTGTIKVTVKQAHATTYYLGNTTTGFNTIGTATLTFIPDHFDVIVTEALQMDCNKVNSLVNPCSPANTNGKFLYADQPFDVRVQAYIGAKDNQGNYRSPHNYTGANARAITLTALNVDGTVAAPDTLVWSSNATSPFSFSYNTNNNDKTLGELSAGNRPSFRFATVPAAPTAPGVPTTIRLRAADSDGASSTGFAEPLITMVSGRLEIANISGPLTGTVPVTAKAQYWNGKAYVFNPQYTSGATPLSLSRSDAGVKTYYLKYSDCKNGFATPCNASAMPKPTTESITFKNGVGSLRLAQPTTALNRNGSFNLSLRNTAFENPTDQEKDKDAELIRYLPSGTGTVIFGVYRSGPIIYMREAYN